MRVGFSDTMKAAKLAVYVVRASRQERDQTRLMILLLVALGTTLIRDTPRSTPTVYLPTKVTANQQTNAQ